MKKEHECRSCKETKPESEFYQTIKPDKTSFVDKLCRSCKVEKNNKRRKDHKAWAVEYKGGKCIACGYNKCLAALDFHHRDPSQKEFGFGTAVWYSREKMKKELDKCDLLCRNCHAEVHARQAEQI